MIILTTQTNALIFEGKSIKIGMCNKFDPSKSQACRWKQFSPESSRQTPETAI